ncbi:MAG: DUF4394 domain-containing protein [Planctomycetota bacterium]
MKLSLPLLAGLFGIAIGTTAAHAQANPATIYGLTARDNRLIAFPAGAPSRIQSALGITGLAAGELLIAMDVRPSTGELYALGRTSRIYRVDPSTGVAIAVGAPFTPALSGSEFGFDFNPVPDRIRIVSNTGQNLRVHPETGQVASNDTPLAFDAGDVNAAATPRVVAAAYTQSFAGASSTTNYAIDSSLDVLLTQGSAGGAPTSPNTGKLFTVGALNKDVSELVAFDISPYGGAFLVSAERIGATSELSSIDLATGAVTVLGKIGASFRIRDIALPQPAPPRVFGVDAANNLISFRPGRASELLSSVAIGGLAAGEAMVGIDFRPSTAELFGVSSASRLYTLDKATAVATPVGAAQLSPLLAGAQLGVDFNPVPDLVRIVSDADENLRVSPKTGAITTTDTPLDFAAGDVNAGQPRTVVAAAYTQSFAGATSTTLYTIDSGLDALLTQGSSGGAPVSPNTGTLFTVGALGFDSTSDIGFDVSPFGGALASMTAPAATSSRLFTINLTTGAAIDFGAIGGPAIVRDIAIEPPAAPVAIALTSAQQIVSFTAGKPESIQSSVAIGGLDLGETVLGIDFRPSTSELLGITSANRLVRIDRVSGIAQKIPAVPFNPALSGAEFAIDINPVPDLLRVVSDLGQNLAISPKSALVTANATPLAFDAGDANAGQSPFVVAEAYAQNFAGSKSTTLYGIDAGLDVLVRQGSIGGAPTSPNSGLLFTIGALGVDATAAGGLDISAHGGAFAVLTRSGQTTSELYRVNVATGATTLIGPIGTGGGDLVRDFAFVPAGL